MELNEMYSYEMIVERPEAIGSYRTDTDGNKTICFDPPVYRGRYMLVNSILSLPQWMNQMKKVLCKNATIYSTLFSNRKYFQKKYFRWLNLDVQKWTYSV